MLTCRHPIPQLFGSHCIIIPVHDCSSDTASSSGYNYNLHQMYVSYIVSVSEKDSEPLAFTGLNEITFLLNYPLVL